MRHPATIVVSAFVWALLLTDTCTAAVVVSPDEVCAPTDDPCTITTTVETSSDTALDFGLRTVKLTGGGRLRGTADLLCGAFEVEGSPKHLWMEITPSGHVTITVQRACSGDSTTPCLSDRACELAGLGTCSLGDGSVSITGVARGRAAPWIEIRAAGDIAIEGKILAKGSPPNGWGGNVYLTSTQDSVELAVVINIGGSRESFYGGPGFSGALVVDAAGDVTIRKRILARGGEGYIGFDAGADLFVSADILANGVPGIATTGAKIEMSAGGNLSIVDPPGRGGADLLNISGGRESSQYGGSYAGAGGYAHLEAEGDVLIGSGVWLKGDSGAFSGRYADDEPYGADWYIEAYGALAVHAKITSRGRGVYGEGGVVTLYADGGIVLGRRALINIHSMYWGQILAYARRYSPLVLDGRLNARGGSRRYYENFYGAGGYISLSGGDVTIRGSALTGGGESGGDINVSACKLRLERGAVIDSSRGRQYLEDGFNSFTIWESMIAERGSRILANREGGNFIAYADPAQPPVLDGRIFPVPELSIEPRTADCPVCGNGKIDYRESCDDGNTQSGDGCSDLCLIE